MAAKRDDILTMDELAEYLKISKSTLYKLAVDGKLPGTKIGKRWRFHKDAIDRWVQCGNVQGDSDAAKKED
jgi:excisionase family DNA binding protein